MGIIVLGKTRCRICDSLLLEAEGIVSFPSFINDSTDPLRPFDEGSFHKTCFDRWPHRARFLELLNNSGR